MQRQHSDQGLVVQRRILGESDLIVVLLCKRLGKLSAVAPAGRKSRKRFGACLELFAQIEVEVIDRGKGGLWRLSEANVLRDFRGIRGDLIAIAHAGYISELSSALIREGQEISKAYQFLWSALDLLDTRPLTAFELRTFELGILKLSGLAPCLNGCLVCERGDKEEWVFDFDQGGLVCQDCQRSGHAKRITKEQYELLVAIDGAQPTGKEDKTSMSAVRWLLARVIDQNLSRELKAREFLRKMAEDEALRSGRGEGK